MIMESYSKNPNSMVGDKCIILAEFPDVPDEKIRIPTRQQCWELKYIYMTQLCNIAEHFGIGRSAACNAFGGNRGREDVCDERKPYEIMAGAKKRKFVKSSAAICYFCKMGIENW